MEQVKVLNEYYTNLNYNIDKEVSIDICIAVDKLLIQY